MCPARPFNQSQRGLLRIDHDESFDLRVFDREVGCDRSAETAADDDHLAWPDVTDAGEVVERGVGILVPMSLGRLRPFALSETAGIKCEDFTPERMQRADVRQRVGGGTAGIVQIENGWPLFGDAAASRNPPAGEPGPPGFRGVE